MKLSILAFSGLVLCGCAHLATVKTIEPHVPTIAASDEKLAVATQKLTAAEREQPLIALGNDLSAAKLSLSVLEQRPNNSSAHTIYNFSVGRAVENIERAKFQPWQHKIDIASDGSVYTLTTPKPVDPEHNASRYDLFPTDSLKIGGTFFKTRSAVSGSARPWLRALSFGASAFPQNITYKLHGDDRRPRVWGARRDQNQIPSHPDRSCQNERQAA